jgi:hypothetical protein
MSEVYVSTDIETDGPIPGPNSMMSLGSAVFDREGRFFDAWTANFEPLPDAKPDPGTELFWRRHPAAFDAATAHRRPVEEAMREYRKWVEALPGTPVFVAYPAGFDFLFVYWYLVRFTGGSPFSFSALDMKSYACAKLGKAYRKSGKGDWPAAWRKPEDGGVVEHTHVALDDAIEQGFQFMAMLRDPR